VRDAQVPSTSGRGFIKAVRDGQLPINPLLSGAAAVGLVVLLALGPLLTAARDLQQLATARAYAVAWDQLDAGVRSERSRGVRDVTVARLASTGNVQNLEFVGTNRRDWFNDCVARYYDLSSIAADA
jgi:hypothetical protein